MGDYDYEEWGCLSLPNGARLSLNHWENIIGRSKSSDVTMDYPTLSRSHAAVIRDDKGQWHVYDLGSKSGVMLNGKPVKERAAIKNGDLITLGGVELLFITYGHSEQASIARERVKPGRAFKPVGTLIFLTAFQLALGLQLCISMDKGLPPAVPVSFLALIALTWFCYILTRTLNRVAFEMETIAFLLCSVGMAVTATAAPGDLYKQIAFLVAGIALYFLIGWFLRDLDRAVKLRWPIAVAGLALLGVNILLSRSVFGAKNWLEIGGVSFQPSEFVKIAFVFAGAATLDRLFAKRNLVLFIAFSGVCVMALALMGDFGTALVFFIAYLTISFIRSGDLAAVFLSVAGAGFAGFLAMTLKPHVAERFSTWGHVWQQVSDAGFQQTRAMMASASGGLFGVGAGNGLRRGHGHGIRRRQRGAWPHHRRRRHLRALDPGVLRRPGLVHVAELLLCDRRFRGRLHPGIPDDPERLRFAGYPAVHGSHVPVRLEGRLKPHRLLGASGLHQGRRHAQKRQLCHQDA